ncbi:hypothetical protein KQX62_12065 [Rhodopseudomonas palustris]|uniref:Uncharacterized protein n=1 Tax=Rhodopseudomonas palustris TaxID=1076 RepID=A0AAX3DRH1_RHOPL|nr:hypothetical protein [Rhodopseudomonas palustris]UYO37494.1 hypothetical protein KQX62_12065 [Rhodopseudomonas palustris]
MLTETFTKERSMTLPANTLSTFPRATKRVAAPRLAPSRSNSQAKNGPLWSAIDDLRRAHRDVAKAYTALRKLTDQHPDLSSRAPSVLIEVGEGKKVAIQCILDFEQAFGPAARHPGLWREIEAALNEARPNHDAARRKSGIPRAEAAHLRACLKRNSAFNHLVLQEPQTREEIRAYARHIMREMEASGPISNSSFPDDLVARQEWNERRSRAMNVALRVLGRLAR